MPLTYSVITPVRDEAETLPTLAGALASQTQLPERWVIVEGGSSDRTRAVASDIVDEHPWARLLALQDVGAVERGAPIVRSIHAGIDSLDVQSDVVVTVDADVSFDETYFQQLLSAFERQPDLGIASGSAWELSDGQWQQRFVTGGTVWGATRAYRRECLDAVLPLEERHGWDGIDQLKARARGWKTQTIVSLPFRHHRPEGTRDGSRWAHWRVNGDTAYYMGYRPSYLVSRSLFHMRRDRSSFALIVGYAAAGLRRSPRLDDPGARAVLRGDQRLRTIARRRREARGRAA